ncbi:MAG: hypothetical protein RLZZ54_1168 [Cyanobacteriota bacterium]|jgi:glycosyltransferase involved in cell wall biosynthesis
MPLAPWEAPAIVAEALESLRQQTLSPQQVVVSCDGTPPPPLRCCLEASGLPIEVLLGPGSEGVGPVLARGLLHCREELVLRVDADDLSLPERAARQVSWMEKHPEVLVMSTAISEFRNRLDQPLLQRWVPLGPEEVRRVARWRNPLNHPSVVLRRSAVLGVGNYRSIPGFEDYELWLRLLRDHGPSALANLPEALVLARVGAAHLGRRHGWRYALAEVRFLLHCGRSGLLPAWSVIRSLLVRVPLRLLPQSILMRVMESATRSAGSQSRGSV